MGLFERLRGARSTPDSLTAQAVARARALAGVIAAEVVDADTITLTWASGARPVDVSLEALRTRWGAASGFERIELLDDWVATLGPPEPDGPAIDAELSAMSSSSQRSDQPPTDPTAGGEEWPSMARRLAIVVTRAAPGDEPTRWRITDDLDAHLALDRADAPAVRPDDLALWGVTLAVARQAALDRLLEAGPSLDPIGRDRDAWVVTAPDHCAAWLAAPAQLAAIAGCTPAIVFAPTASEVVVVDAGAAGTVADVARSTLAITDSQHDLLCPAPLIIEADSIRLWEPPPGHPAAGFVARLPRPD